MTGLNHGWDKDEPNHADFKHNGVDVEDFYKEVNYAPKRKKKNCKKNKGQPCNFTVVIKAHSWYDVVTCSHCGKHGKYIWKPIN